MENYINQVVDLPKMVNDKIPVNINSMLDDSERNMSKWVGMFYKLASLLFIAGALYNLLSPLWGDRSLPDGKDLIAMFIGLLIWLYAAFPMSQIIRSAGDSLESSDSGIIKFIFKDLVLANIRLVGQILALSALFTAICMSLSWVLDMTIAGSVDGSMDSVYWMFELPMAVTADFAMWVDKLERLLSEKGIKKTSISAVGGPCLATGLANRVHSSVVIANKDILVAKKIAEMINTNWGGWTLGAESGEAHSWSGLIACCWAFAGVVLALAQLYVSMAIYTFLFALGTSFMNWFKNPYLPTKSI